MKPYQEWILLAKRWDACVDFGSPMSAWTSAMLTQRAAEQAKEQAKPE